MRVEVFVSFNRDCQNVLNDNQGLAGHSDSFRQFEGGVKLGIGSFNLVGFFSFYRNKTWFISSGISIREVKLK